MITIAHNYIELSVKGPGNYWYSWRSTDLDMKIQKTTDDKVFTVHFPRTQKSSHSKHYFVGSKSTEINFRGFRLIISPSSNLQFAIC